MEQSSFQEPKGAGWLHPTSSSVQHSRAGPRRGEERKDAREGDGRERKRKGGKRMRKERREGGSERWRQAGGQTDKGIQTP